VAKLAPLRFPAAAASKTLPKPSWRDLPDLILPDQHVNLDALHRSHQYNQRWIFISMKEGLLVWLGLAPCAVAVLPLLRTRAASQLPALMKMPLLVHNDEVTMFNCVHGPWVENETPL
jgi:hypothetical protein